MLHIFKYVNSESVVKDGAQFTMSSLEFDRSVALVELSNAACQLSQLQMEGYRLQVMRDLDELNEAMSTRAQGFEHDRMGSLPNRHAMVQAPLTLALTSTLALTQSLGLIQSCPRT